MDKYDHGYPDEHPQGYGPPDSLTAEPSNTWIDPNPNPYYPWEPSIPSISVWPEDNDEYEDSVTIILPSLNVVVTATSEIHSVEVEIGDTRVKCKLKEE